MGMLLTAIAYGAYGFVAAATMMMRAGTRDGGRALPLGYLGRRDALRHSL